MEVLGAVASFIAIGQALAAVPKIVASIKSICKPGSELMLSEKAELVRVASPDGDTLLHIACRHNAPDTANLLLRRGALLDARGYLQHTPLLCGTLSGAKECVQILLDKGADVNATNATGWSPVICASGSDSSTGNNILKSLLDAGARIRTRDIEEETALHHFCAENTTALGVDMLRERLKLILDAGGDCLLEAMRMRMRIDQEDKSAQENGDPVIDSETIHHKVK